MIDPWDELLQRTFASKLPTQPLPREEQPLLPLSPEEEDSILSSAGGKVMGGLGYVGGLLDKYTGGRAVRGLLGGKPKELLSLLPGSDALGITDENDRVSGQNLLENAGIVDKGSDSWGAMLGGIATEIALSPSTYVSFGGSALTKGGLEAAKIGALPTSMLGRIKGLSTLNPTQVARAKLAGVNTADILNKPLGGVMGFGLPFAKPSAIVGAGKGGEAFAQGLSAAGSAVRQAPVIRPVMDAVGKVTEPVGRYWGALFNPEMAGSFSKSGQAVAPAMMEGVEDGMAAVRGRYVDIARRMEAEGLDNNMVRRVGELAGKEAGPLLPKEQAALEVANHMRNSPFRAKAKAMGFVGEDLVDEEVDFVARHLTHPTRGPAIAGEQQTFPIAQATLSGRDPIFKNIPGGTVEGLNPSSMNPALSGLRERLPPSQIAPLEQRAAIVRKDVLRMTAQDEADLTLARALQSDWEKEAVRARFAGQPVAPSPLTPEQQLLVSRAEQSEKLADYYGKLSKEYADTQTPMFNNLVVDDMMRTDAAYVRQAEAGEAVHKMLAEAATPLDQAGPGTVRLEPHMLQSMGFSNPQQASAALQEFLDQAGKSGDLWVPKTVVSDATRFIQGHTTPAALEPVLKAIDSVTNLTKAYQTAMWPAFHTRNFVSGMWQNFVLGARDARFAAADPRTWVQPVMDAQTLLRGGTVKDLTQLPLFAGMTDEAATAALGKMAYQYRATSHGVHAGMDVIGQQPTLTEHLSKIPGDVPFEGFARTAARGVTGLAEPGGWNPAGVSGAFGFNKDTFAPMAAGRKIGTAVEDTNRLSAFIGLIRQGFHPAEAAKQVRAAHVDYAALAPFERSVMRRIIPFYSYSRRIIPWTIEKMIERPGGLSGSLAQATYSLRQQDETFVPSWMGGGLAIPIGDEANGTQRFLTKLDTPAETAFEFMRPGIGETGTSLLGQTNPLIKAPLEIATGKQMFTGRDLDDLYPITGSTMADQAIMNSPLSRFFTSGRQLGQVATGRKGIGAAALNLGSGVRLTDVDQEKARDIAARELIKDRLQGQEGIGRFETIYPRPGMLGSLTPEEIALLRLGKSLDVKARERAKQQQGVGR